MSMPRFCMSFGASLADGYQPAVTKHQPPFELSTWQLSAANQPAMIPQQRNLSAASMRWMIEHEVASLGKTTFMSMRIESRRKFWE